MGDYKLCYIEEPWAYFTTQDLDKQWGDDWDDAPYDCNAGSPYRWYDIADGEVPWDIVKVAFDGPLVTPSGDNFHCPYSVEEINSGAVAWLKTPKWWSKKSVVIQAGASLEEFISKVEEVGGTVYRAVNQ